MRNDNLKHVRPRAVAEEHVPGPLTGESGRPSAVRRLITNRSVPLAESDGMGINNRCGGLPVGDHGMLSKFLRAHYYISRSVTQCEVRDACNTLYVTKGFAPSETRSEHRGKHGNCTRSKFRQLLQKQGV